VLRWRGDSRPARVSRFNRFRSNREAPYCAVFRTASRRSPGGFLVMPVRLMLRVGDKNRRYAEFSGRSNRSECWGAQGTRVAAAVAY